MSTPDLAAITHVPYWGHFDTRDPFVQRATQVLLDAGHAPYVYASNLGPVWARCINGTCGGGWALCYNERHDSDGKVVWPAELEWHTVYHPGEACPVPPLA